MGSPFLQLRDVHVLGPDPGLLEGPGGCLGRRRGSRLHRIDGLKTSKEPKRRVRNAMERSDTGGRSNSAMRSPRASTSATAPSPSAHALAGASSKAIAGERATM